MMKSMRKHTKTILWIVVFAFLGTIFLVWGMDLGRRQSSLENVSAAVVAGEAISYTDFARHWEQHYRQITTATDRELSPREIQDMRKKLMESLIDSTLLKQQFDRLKLKVSPQEVAARIGSIPAFQENGSFASEKYFAMLRYNRISPGEFEAEQENAIKIFKITQHLQDSVVITASEVRDYFRSRSRKLKLQVVAFHWKNLLPSLSIPQSEIQAYFTARRKEYDRPEEVKAAHILIGVAANATEEEKLTAKLKLENIRIDIQKGADFADMAKQHSDDPGSKDKGGDLGFFRRGMMVKPFEETAFGLKINELSDIVETPFGFHLIKVTDKRAAKKSTLAEVRGKILKTLKEEKARQQNQEAALKFMQLLEDKSVHLGDAAREAKTKISTTSWIKDDDTLPDIEDSETIVDQAFNLPLYKPSNSILAGEGIYFVEVIKEQHRPFKENLYNLEYDTYLEKLKNLRGLQAVRDWLQQARAEAEIVNNIEKESNESPSSPASGQ